MGQTVWPQEHVDYAIKLWDDDLSALKIATALEEKFNTYYSRNAVIGKIHRDHPKYADRKKVKLSKVGAYELKQGSIVSTKILLRDAKPNQCLYSQDTGADMMVCGKKTYKHYPYCHDCCNIAYRKFEEHSPIKIGPQLTGTGLVWT